MPKSPGLSAMGDATRYYISARASYPLIKVRLVIKRGYDNLLPITWLGWGTADLFRLPDRAGRGRPSPDEAHAPAAGERSCPGPILDKAPRRRCNRTVDAFRTCHQYVHMRTGQAVERGDRSRFAPSATVAGDERPPAKTVPEGARHDESRPRPAVHRSALEGGCSAPRGPASPGLAGPKQKRTVGGSDPEGGGDRGEPPTSNEPGPGDVGNRGRSLAEKSASNTRSGFGPDPPPDVMPGSSRRQCVLVRASSARIRARAGCRGLRQPLPPGSGACPVRVWCPPARPCAATDTAAPPLRPAVPFSDDARLVLVGLCRALGSLVGGLR